MNEAIYTAIAFLLFIAILALADMAEVRVK
jgi:hypothetical protein